MCIKFFERGGAPEPIYNPVEGAEVVKKCEICKAPTVIDPFLTSCRHACCRSCIKVYFERVIHTQISCSQLSFRDLTAQIVCPNLSCQEELSHRELVDLLGPKAVKLYERWLASISDKLYSPTVANTRYECTNSKCFEAESPSTVVLASTIPCLTAAEVRYALEVRGNKKFLKYLCARELSRAVRLPDKEGNRAVWLCTTCDASWCGACGCELPFITTQRDRKTVHRQCTGKQRYEIHKCLLELEVANKVYTQGKQSPSEKNSRASNVGNTIWAGGTGYGGEYIDSRSLSDSTQAAARKEEHEVDSNVEKQIGFLTSVLKGQSPSLTISICAMICWENALPRILQQLAKNDSMLDISDRSSLYLKMVSLLNEMQLHGELHPMLAGSGRQDVGRDDESWIDQWVGLERTTSRGATREDAADDAPADRDNSLLNKLGNIYRQAKVMIQNMPQTDGNHGADVDMSLARELCKCYENLQEVVSRQDIVVCEENNRAASPTAAEEVCTDVKAKQVEPDDQAKANQLEPDDQAKAKQLEPDDQEKAKQPAPDDQEGRKLEPKPSATQYKEALSKMQFRQLCMVDERGEYRHHFKDNITGKAANSTCIDKRGVHNQKRMIHLSKEIASLATTLPLEWESSIHLCVDEARVDVLRALIIGPQGTPYQNGLFFFDIFLPPDYPQVPPSVHFLTTGGGKVRFNPNLYDSGKICLSLLGTWSGPGWIPGKSTLLQVLVSIQSLIFVKDPYYNEPGFEQTKSPEAEKENRRHREHTLSLAVLGPLRKPDPFFSDIVREHFRFKNDEVQTQCDDWVAATPEGYARQRIANLACDIKKELQSLDIL